MDRRLFLKEVAAGTAALSLSGCAGILKHHKKPPNFVIIFTDDQGYGDVGCYGAKGFETPNIDRMASDGVRFTSFYSMSPACSPSRAGLLTGCYPMRVGIPSVLGPRSETGLNPSEITIAKLLKQQGYATACYGKWHLGHYPEFMPLNHGFDEYFGLPYSNDMYPRRHDDPSDPRNTDHPDLPLIEGNEVVEYYPDQSQLTTQYTEHAVGFIEKNRDRPFFLYVPHSMPHVPLHVSDKFKGKSEQGMYGDVIMEIDWSVGQILAALRKNGLDENTLVVFTSDNGPWLPFGDHAGSSGPLREGKGTTFEGGMRMPCIMRWCGKVPANSLCNEMAAMMDLYPTIAKLAGADLPSDRIIDGKNIWPLISGKPKAQTPHEVFYYYWPRQLQAVRSGKWKLHLPHEHRCQVGEPGTGGKSGGEQQREIGLSLYDLEADIGETTNLVDEHPDVVARLTALAEKAREDIGDGLTKRRGKNVRPAGKHQ